MPVIIRKPASPALKQLRLEKEALEARWFKLLEQGEAVRNKIEGLNIAIAILEQGDQVGPEPQRAAPTVSNVKVMLLDFARECGGGGINANIAVQMAEKKGFKLLRGTAASNLSRLKNDNALVHDGDKYKLPEFTRPQLQMAVSNAVVGGGKGS